MTKNTKRPRVTDQPSVSMQKYIDDMRAAAGSMRITGTAAIAHAEAHGLSLSTYTDPTAEARDGVSVDEAREIAREDASLVYIDVDAAALATECTRGCS